MGMEMQAGAKLKKTCKLCQGNKFYFVNQYLANCVLGDPGKDVSMKKEFNHHTHLRNVLHALYASGRQKTPQALKNPIIKK